MSSYTYAPLAKSEIRLVTVSQAEQDGQLQATIQHVELNTEDPITYTALSYCWGDPASRVEVPCDGKLLNITTSLHEALCEIIKFSPHKALWIDQICINQGDMLEKAQQVSMMNVIYDKAETVLAWLGPAVDSTSTAVDFVKKVGEIAMPTATDMFRWDNYGDDHEATKLERVEEFTQEQSQELGIPFDNFASWDSFSEFFDRAWFQRMWTVQEIIQARKAIVVCGAYSLPWEYVSAAARWFCHKAKAIHERNKRQVDGMCLATQMVMIPWRAKMGSEYNPQLLGQKTRPTCKWGLRDLLERLRPRLATDPRDKVYALVAISEVDDQFCSDEGSGIDYSLSVREVYTQATNEIIKSDPTADLDVIWSARQRSSEPGWPSWVPDWRLETGYGCSWGIGQPLKTSGRPNGVHTYIPTDEPLTLAVQGKIIGKVTHTNQYRHLGELFQHNRLREVYDACMDRLKSYPTGEQVETAFGLTLIGGQPLTKALIKAETSLETYTAKYMDFYDVTQMSRATPEEDAARNETLKGFYQLGFDRGWIEAILNTYCERRFYVTDTGYMGLGHHEMIEGDMIAVVVGLRWPCVLRPKSDNHDDGFEFIGEAYCHGMMDGEGIQDLPQDEDGSYQGQQFLLK
ncbi:hypothetical protein NM208_g7761 [Fusarium decemcellulare]|uniref:Uncharacterized protein n=1 Tax=Fusarium decemcellulare TaxID=57161 RepID=A0ACC1S7Y8_9HYPO|nr:hypothetical protein NM208_g7761 [Fusarium decemcellulare]